MPSSDGNGTSASPFAALLDRSVAVWGLGLEGRAALDTLGALRLSNLAVVDDRESSYTTRGGRTFTALTGDAGRAALLAADAVLKSPGISRYDPRAVEVVAAGHALTSGTALWMSAHHAQTVAVTGSKGKSTTSSLISHLLSALGQPNRFGGNIGAPLVTLPPADRYVVELSSYQCSDLRVSPQVAVLTSLFPEHLNWHGSVERYYADKLNVVAHGPRAVVYNGRDARLVEHLSRTAAVEVGVPAGLPGGFDVETAAGGWRFTVGGATLFDGGTWPLRGVHNAVNICLALATLAVLGVDCLERRREIEAALRRFVPLEHRLTTIDDPSGLLFVDDSISTAPEAAVAAMDALPDGPLAIILGGEDRGLSYAALRESLAAASREVVAIGIPESGPRILTELGDLPRVTCIVVDDLYEAVAVARRELPARGTVLLSPAAPSYGRYVDFAERGRAFTDAVRRTRD